MNIRGRLVQIIEAKLLSDIIKAIIVDGKSIDWVEDKYDLDARDILAAFLERERKSYESNPTSN